MSALREMRRARATAARQAGIACLSWLLAMAAASEAVPIQTVSGADALAGLAAPLTDRERVFAADLMRGEAGELLSGEAATALAAGRYRVHVPLAMAPFGDPNTSDLSVTITAGRVERVLRSDAFAGPDRFTDATVEFSVAGSERAPVRVKWAIGPIGKLWRQKQVKPPETPAVGAADEGGADDLLEALEQDPDGAVGVERLKTLPGRLIARRPVIEALQPLAVERVRSRKVLYSPGEGGVLDVLVKNHAASAQSGRVRVSLLSGLGDEQVLLERPVALDGRKELAFEVPFQAAGRWGFAARAVVAQEGSTHESEDYFGVSEHLWEVGIGFATPVMTQRGLDVVDEIVAAMRARRSNWIDVFFWAPCDWAKLVPDGKLWWGGQGSYAHDDDNLRELIGRLHAQGMRASAYASCNPAGPYGWEVYRRHPEWFTGPGPWNAEQLDRWNDPDWRRERAEAKAENPGWFRLGLDLRQLAPLDYGIERIVESAKYYGWDAVRFDGHYTTGDAETSARNMRRLKERVWRDVPGFLFGFNYGRAPEWAGGVTHEMREGMAGGGLYMQEGIRNWRHTADQYQSWSFYATNELRIAKQVQAMGGTYHCIWEVDNPALTAAQRYYKLVYGLIAGGHPCYGSHHAAPGCSDWGAFLTRWSAVLWDRNLRVAAEQAARFQVEPQGVQWKPFVQERVESAARKQVMVHLVTAPTSDLIAQSELPAVAGKPLTVTFRPEAGVKVRRAVLIRPDSRPFDQPLRVEAAGDAVRVTVPEMQRWALVVWELEGAFQLPPEPPKFTEPPKPAQAVASPVAGAVRVDPNRDAVETAAPNVHFVALDHGSANIGKPMVGDADSLQGTVQGRREDQAAVRLGLWWIPLSAPGKYRLEAAIKWTDGRPAAVPQRLEMSVRDHENWDSSEVRTVLVTPGYTDPPAGAVTMAERGQYRFYPIGTVDKRKPGCVNVVGQATTATVGGNALFLERLKLELVEPYTDRAVAAQADLPAKPEGLRVPAGAAPKRILFVKGMFSQPYLQGTSLSMDLRYACPTNHEALYAYDAIVLCNLPAPELPQRKMLKDFVEDGGRLVILGGCFTLGQGNFPNTFLGDILPVVLKGAGEVVRLDPPLLLGQADGQPYEDKPALFWRHEVDAGTGSRVLAWAGGRPIAFGHGVGKGLVQVFAGTVQGEGTKETKPFWECASWRDLLKRMITE